MLPERQKKPEAIYKKDCKPIFELESDWEARKSGPEVQSGENTATHLIKSYKVLKRYKQQVTHTSDRNNAFYPNRGACKISKSNSPTWWDLSNGPAKLAQLKSDRSPSALEGAHEARGKKL